MGRGMFPGFRGEAFPGGPGRPGSDAGSDDDSEYASSDEERRREREHRRREKDRERSRDRRERFADFKKLFIILIFTVI